MRNGKVSTNRVAKSKSLAMLAIGVFSAFAFYQLGTHPNTHEFAKISQVPVVLEEKMSIDASIKKEALTEPLTASKELVVSAVLISTPISTEKIVWDRLISEGFTREQTAGIMGNLQQEHNFKTSDAPGGLGIAQWLGNRRANLMARESHTDINVQLTFMMDELRSTEHRAMRMLKAANTVEGATIAFQNGYERCGNCKQAQRIAYAYEWYKRF